MTGAPTGLNIATTLNGSLRVTGQIANQGGNLTGALGGLLGDKLGDEVQKLTDARARPARRHPRQRAGDVAAGAAAELADRAESHRPGHARRRRHAVAGVKLNVANEVKPLLDKTVNEQIGSLSNRLRDDRTLETAARSNGRRCAARSRSARPRAGAPNLWLEVRPTRAFAAQPRSSTDWVILTLGVQAETRIVPSATKPDCPFPAQLDLVPQIDQGSVARRADRRAVHRAQPR